MKIYIMKIITLSQRMGYLFRSLYQLIFIVTLPTYRNIYDSQ